VPRQLEAEWEAVLGERARLGEEYERYQQRARPGCRPPSWPRSAPWPGTSRRCGPRRPPPWPTARGCCVVIESVQVTAEGTTERVQATVT
jgi:hypothetical protein